MISVIATTNSGRDVTASATTELAWSKSESLRRAATTPSVTPTRVAITPDTATSTAEFSAAGPTMPHTGIPLARLFPG
jgi:hypothetical protein